MPRKVSTLPKFWQIYRQKMRSFTLLHGTMKLVSTTCPWVHAPRKILKQKTYISCNSMTQIRAGYYSS